MEATAPESEWLEEFLLPQFAVRRATQPDCHARLVVNAARYAKLAACGPHPSGRIVPCFTLDGGVLAGPVWNVPGETCVVFDEAAKVFYRRRHEERRVIEVIASDATPGARVALMRVVREWGMRFARRAGWLISHAAAVALDGAAFVIAGPKGAGKTTLLMHILLHMEKASFIANDRASLSFDGADIVVTGVPTIVSLRPSVAAWDSGLQARLREAPFHHRHSLAEAAAVRDAGGMVPASASSLSPKQLCQVLGVESRAAACVTALVFPSVTPSVSGGLVEQLPAEDALALLRSATFSEWSPDSPMDVGDDGEPLPDQSVSPEELVGRVPSFRCRLGTEAYRDGMPWFDRLRPR